MLSAGAQETREPESCRAMSTNQLTKALEKITIMKVTLLTIEDFNSEVKDSSTYTNTSYTNLQKFQHCTHSHYIVIYTPHCIFLKNKPKGNILSSICSKSLLKESLYYCSYSPSIYIYIYILKQYFL